MGTFNKTVIIPIISVICIAIKLVLGVEINEDIQTQITDIIFNTFLLGTILYGIFKNHKDELNKE